MGTLDLKLGKSYRNDLGDVCTIVGFVAAASEDHRLGYRYRDDCGHTYTPEGAFDNNCQTTALNLREEVL